MDLHIFLETRLLVYLQYASPFSLSLMLPPIAAPTYYSISLSSILVLTELGPCQNCRMQGPNANF